MKNQVQEGKVLQYTNGTGSAIASGAVVVLGDRVAIAAVDIPDTESGSVVTEGVFGPIDVVTAEYAALVVGDQVWWNAGTSEATTTALTHNVMGIVAEKLGADQINVKLNA